MTNCRYCPDCNYAILKAELEAMRADCPCPRCGNWLVSEFYAIGSRWHKRQLEKWHAGDVSHPPPSAQ